MISVQVNDMTCGHCVGAITAAVRTVDETAEVAIDLAAHRVDVQSSRIDASRLIDLIREAGYTAQRFEGPQPPAPKRSGCCCAGR